MDELKFKLFTKPALNILTKLITRLIRNNTDYDIVVEIKSIDIHTNGDMVKAELSMELTTSKKTVIDIISDNI